MNSDCSFLGIEIGTKKCTLYGCKRGKDPANVCTILHSACTCCRIARYVTDFRSASQIPVQQAAIPKRGPYARSSSTQTTVDSPRRIRSSCTRNERPGRASDAPSHSVRPKRVQRDANAHHGERSLTFVIVAVQLLVQVQRVLDRLQDKQVLHSV